ncbi:MAG TPA: hypothetical protein PKL77_11115 [Candidatus Omnitrophota bacterium]|nr:hypothetical protein [Candidatus Omnitrophota bacterium]
MAFQLDTDGNIVFDTVTGLSKQVSGLQSLEQDAISECRCEQGGNFADATYGRDPLVWKLSQKNADKINDIKRIVTKYYTPYSISYDNGIITVN